MLNLPFGFKNMLAEIVGHRSSLLHNAHDLDYNINGTYAKYNNNTRLMRICELKNNSNTIDGAVRLIDADIPGGHIVRIR